jgi:hypothetical protein
MPEFAVTLPYVDSNVDSNTCTMGNPMPDSTLTLQYARVDFIPRSRLRIWPQKKSEACTINYTDDKDPPARKFSGINCHLCRSVQYIFAEGPGGSGAKHRNCGKKSLMVKAHYLLLMCIVFYVCNKSIAWSQILSGLGRLKSALSTVF